MIKFDYYFNLEKISLWSILVSFKNGRLAGEFVWDVDGFWYFNPRFENQHGWIDSAILRLLADRLDEMNAAWEEELRKYWEEELNKDSSNAP